LTKDGDICAEAISVPPVIAVHKAHSVKVPFACELVKKPSTVKALPVTLFVVATRGERGVVNAVVDALGVNAPVPTA
jgi:hypothetical protein